MAKRSSLGIAALLLGIAAAVGLAVACGGSPKAQPVSGPKQTLPLPPPAADASPPGEGSAGGGVPDAGASSPAADTPLVAPSAAPEPTEPAETKRSQSPIDLVTTRDSAFLVDYANSDPKQKAQSACEMESKGDAERQGTCLTKARDRFMPDVLRFRKTSETRAQLVIYKRSGSTLRELWTGTVELSEPTSDSLKVKLTGSQKGTRPLWLGKSEGIISVPNEYSLELDDPLLGHLRYDAKIGLVSD